MTATVEIITNKVKNALVAPIQAVAVREDTSATARAFGNSDEQDKSFEVVFIPVGEKVDVNVVKSGIQDDEFIILEGVADSTEIVIGPYSAVSRQLKKGSSIKLQEKK
jgi:HlyD family secretion protein